MAQLAGSPGVGVLDRRHQLGDDRQVVRADSGAKRVAHPVDELAEQLPAPGGKREHVLGRRERAGQGHGHRAGVGVG
jgi:hypothetical protein